jgi:hypothetical protein
MKKITACYMTTQIPSYGIKFEPHFCNTTVRSQGSMENQSIHSSRWEMDEGM